MKPGARAGRVGGLAVALWLGAAAVTGFGVSGVAHAAPVDSPSSTDTNTDSNTSNTANSAASIGHEAADTHRPAKSGPAAGPSERSRDAATETTHEEPDADTTPDDDEEGPITADGGSTPDEPRVKTGQGAGPDSDQASPTDEVAVPETVDAPTPAAPTVVSSVAAVGEDPLATGAGGLPADPPAQTPLAWTLLGFARRQLGQSSPEPELTVDLGASTPSSATPSPTAARSEVSSVDSTPAATISVLTPTPPLTWNGQPSIIHQVVTTVLRLVQPLLVAFEPVVNVFLRGFPFISDGVPPFYLTLGLDVERTEFDGIPVYTLAPSNPTGKQVVAVHGGAYTVEILPLQWSTYADMVRDTGATVIVPIYPLAPQGTAGDVVPTVADLVSSVIAEHGAENVSLMGDSAGAGLALAAAQQLVVRGDALPSSIVLISPWLDATISDPRSQTISDPFLTIPSLVRSGAQWAGDLPGGAANPLVSPLNGSLDGLPPMYVYTGTKDLLSPDSLRLKTRADLENADVTLICREGLMHGWIDFPIYPEARAERPGIYRQLGLIDAIDL